MRIASSVTAISWIPSDAIEGMPKLPFELGVARYDAPPPDHLEEDDLKRLRSEDRFREANHIAAWIEVDDGKIVDHGYEGTGLVGSTTFNLGIRDITIPGVAFEVLRHEPEIQDVQVELRVLHSAKRELDLIFCQRLGVVCGWRRCVCLGRPRRLARRSICRRRIRPTSGRLVVGFRDRDRGEYGWEPAIDSWLCGADPAFSGRLGAAGFLGLTIPKEYGGHELGHLHRYVVTEEDRSA